MPTSNVLPPKLFAKWYRMKEDMGPGLDINRNDLYDWVPTTDNNAADNAAAQAYLSKGRTENAAYASSQESSQR